MPGALVFIIGALFFVAAASETSRSTWPWWLGRLAFLGSMGLWRTERWSLEGYHPENCTDRKPRHIPQPFCDGGLFACPRVMAKGQPSGLAYLCGLRSCSQRTGCEHHLGSLLLPCSSSLVLPRKDIIHLSGALIFVDYHPRNTSRLPASGSQQGLCL